MRITYFRIENFRNLRLAECTDPPDFMVICGGNGCGKSAVLHALMTAKEHAGSYGNFDFDPRVVSADSDRSLISVRLSFNQIERDFVQRQFNTPCPQDDEIIIEIKKGGQAKATKRSQAARNLLGWYSKSFLDSPGFFDYIDAYRPVPKGDLSNWDASFLSDQRAKETLGARGTAKFANTKAYLAGLIMRDIQEAQASHRAGRAEFGDSLKPIREFFDGFFAPMRFVDVLIHKAPFQYVIETPRGIIDIDDLSAGEKEVLNTFIRFHQLNPRGAVILFDEADAHLHLDLERRYLKVLQSIGRGNQFWLTSHSPEMMMAAGSDSLYTVLKAPQGDGGSQFARVTSSEALYAALSDVMGSRGLVSFNQRIIFIEGEEASADREVYEKLYPPSSYHVTYVPAGNSATVRKTAERVNEMLTAAIGFQHYYSIADGDIDRAIAPPPGGRFHQLPVYHVENLLLDESLILQSTRDFLGPNCPYRDEAALAAALKEIVLENGHMKPFTKALLDARMARAAKAAYDAVYRNEPANIAAPSFVEVEQEAVQIMRGAVADGAWKAKCKGRDLLKAYCAKHGMKYEHFRNSIIAKIQRPPAALDAIMQQILA